MPGRLARYLLRETAGLYLIGVAAFCLLLSIDLLSVLARFLVQQSASLEDVGRLLAYKLPWFLHLSLPIALVFAILLATGRMARDSELKAAYTLGAPPRALLVPLAVFGLLMSGVALLNNGYLEARAETAYQDLIDSFLYVRPPAQTQTNVSFRIDDAGVFFASRLRGDLDDHDVATLQGVLVLLPDGTALTAAEGVWRSDDRTWELHDAERSLPGGGTEQAGDVTLPFALMATADETLARSETLPLDELASSIRATMRAGGDAAPLRYQLHRRIADASSALVFAVIAAAIGLRLRGRAAGFAWTIMLLVAFWALWFFSGNLFEAGAAGPVAAAWMTPLIAGVAALALALRSLRA